MATYTSGLAASGALRHLPLGQALREFAGVGDNAKLLQRGTASRSRTRDAEAKRRFAISVATNGGTGARPGKDGLSATAYPSGVKGTPVEIVETTTPLLFWRKEFRRDSGGPGTQRGGHGLELEIENRSAGPIEILAAFDRTISPDLPPAPIMASSKNHQTSIESILERPIVLPWRGKRPASPGLQHQGNRLEQEIFRGQGGCMCGAVRYAIAEKPLATALYHCNRCRPQSGSAFSK